MEPQPNTETWRQDVELVRETRNADLADLAEILKGQRARKVDLVVPASRLRSKGGFMVVEGAEQVITEDGVTSRSGVYLPTDVFDEGVSAKLKIPRQYLRRLREDAIDMYDSNVNGWLHGKSIVRGNVKEVKRPGDDRSFLFRAFKADDGEIGVARALLSDKYGPIENLDILVATKKGIERAGVDVEVVSADLTDRNMHLRMACPAVAALAPTLLNGYRSPFEDPEVDEKRRHGHDLERWRAIAEREGMGYGGNEPVVYAGFDVRNSEVGGGAFNIVPVITIRVCRNGLTMPAFSMRRVHLGSKLEEGFVQWSNETQQKKLELITEKTKDTVQTFLDPAFLQERVAEIEEKAGAKVTSPEKTVKQVAKTLNFSEAEIDGVLEHFIRGGSMTGGGLASAITSFSQTVPNADRARDLDDVALRAMDLVAG